ncbi:hypothetical protein C2S53_000454 [Perilla frutescens var. hirtella]|uniref:Uncharacterized protein n=1 Tax=Perilla frutescens var. hirtella TaxID=608512 RepID=A0AAD4JGC8_PERFH|nr:hypothetical protein C2S53_000454 [Perilla frutescens var. hirtella]
MASLHSQSRPNPYPARERESKVSPRPTSSPVTIAEEASSVVGQVNSKIRSSSVADPGAPAPPPQLENRRNIGRRVAVFAGHSPQMVAGEGRRKGAFKSGSGRGGVCATLQHRWRGW